MNQIKVKLFFLFLMSFVIRDLWAQGGPSKGWDAIKIRGTTQEFYNMFEGKPYYTDSWSLGKIVFANGETLDSLYIKYSSFKDELIYYNKVVNAQIRIDKTTVSAFSFTDENGIAHSFRKQQFDNSARGERYFEILSPDEPNLLCYRKVNLSDVSPYRDKNGILKNTAYKQEYLYYFYSPEKGYSSVKPNKSSLLSHFDKESQRPIKKLLRKNGISILDEFTFTVAWQTIQKNGFKVLF